MQWKQYITIQGNTKHCTIIQNSRATPSTSFEADGHRLRSQWPPASPKTKPVATSLEANGRWLQSRWPPASKQMATGFRSRWPLASKPVEGVAQLFCIIVKMFTSFYYVRFTESKVLRSFITFVLKSSKSEVKSTTFVFTSQRRQA